MTSVTSPELDSMMNSSEGKMIEANALRKGTTFTEDNELFQVLNYSHSQVARAGATVRVRVRNLRSGAIFEKTFRSPLFTALT